MNTQNSQDIYNKNYFMSGNKTAYNNYFVQQEKIFNPFWMKYIDRYSQQSPNKKHLDVGCACGTLVNIMLKNKWNSYGIDISNYAISEGKKIYEMDNIQQKSCTKLPFLDNQFGYITCIDVIEHLVPEDLEMCISEIHRCLYKQGVVFIATPNLIDNCLVDHLSNDFIEHDKSHVNYQSCMSLYLVLKNFGFSNIIVKGASPFMSQVTEASFLKNRIIKKIFSNTIFKILENNLSYSNYLFAIASK